MLLPETELQVAINVSNKLLNTISESEFKYEDEIIKFTVSMGIGIYNNENISIDEIIKKTDEYLYLAKKNGRNTIEFKH